jgi:hypothetical protein
MKSICFKCRFVGIGMDVACCPACGFPLIMNTEPVALAARELEALFNQRAQPHPLPGVDPEPRKAQLLAERRRVRAMALLEARKEHDRRCRRRRLVGEIMAASAIVAGALLVLQRLGAL